MQEVKTAAVEAAGDGARPQQSAEMVERLDDLGISLAQKRAEAIKARKASGIEDQWREDEEFYESVDDANRGESINAWSTKPPGQGTTSVRSTRSTVFVPLVRPYVDVAASSLCDIALPSDEANFKIGPTPVPTLIDISKGKFPKEINSAADAYAAPGLLAGMVGKGTDESKRQEFLLRQKQKAEEIIKEAQEKADKAQTRVEDWLTECQFNDELRQSVHDGAKVGVGIIKGPIPEKKRHVAFKEGALIIHEEICPVSKRVDYWNFYPDGSCGESIHNGSYTFERDHLTDKQLNELKGMPGYIDSQIDECLKEGPMTDSELESPSSESQPKQEKKGQYQIWYMHGILTAEDLRSANCECEDSDRVPAMVTMVNNRVVRAAVNPLDSGELPYDVFRWQKKKGHWAGVGVSRQGRTPQRIVNAATRNLMDNAGLAAGGMLIFKQGVVAADGGQMRIAPRMVYYASADSDIEDVGKAFRFVEVPMRQDELLAIVEFGMKLMEDATSLPMLLQGQQGKAPDTVGGMQILNNNANTTRRNLGRTLDADITKPHVHRYYTWLLQYGEDEEKGEFVIEAKGSSALVEIDIQNQEIPTLLQASANPIYKIDPAKTMREYLRSRKFNIANFEYDDEEWQKIVEQLAQKPQDGKVEAAQIKAQTDVQIAQFRAQAETQLEGVRGEISKALEGMKLQAEAQEKAKDRQLEIVLADAEREIEAALVSTDKDNALTAAKTKLADTVMKLRTQERLSIRQEALRPPTEPKGRAPKGQSFQR